MDSVKKTPLQKNKIHNQYRDYDKMLALQKADIQNGLIEKNSPVSTTEPKNNRCAKKHPLKWRRLIFFIFALILFSALGEIIFLVWKISSVSKKITISGENVSLAKNVRSLISPATSKRAPLKGEAEGRVNILLLGAAGESNPGKNLTDTIMILSIDTRNNKVALLSLPRDLYIRVPDENFHTKINSLYQYGLNKNSGTDLIAKTAEDITALKLHYFLVLDFDGFRKIIDDIGGINVTVERDIFDNRYPGPNYSYETFEIKKGLHKMDGATALKYVRVRHNDPEGDFGRAKRQQQTLQSVKNKIFSLRTFLNVLTMNKMLTTLENNLKTNIQLGEVDSFIWWIKQVDSQNINNAVVDAWKKDSLLKVSHVYLSGKQVFILIPRVGNYNEIKDLAENIFNLNKLNEVKKELEEEDAKITLINHSADPSLAGKIKDTLEEKLNFKSVIIKPGKLDEAQEQTFVYDRSGGKKIFSLNEIVRKVPAILTAENNDIIDPTEDSDFIITLGRALEEIYKYEENTMDELNNAEEGQDYILE